MPYRRIGQSGPRESPSNSAAEDLLWLASERLVAGHFLLKTLLLPAFLEPEPANPESKSGNRL